MKYSLILLKTKIDVEYLNCESNSRSIRFLRNWQFEKVAPLDVISSISVGDKIDERKRQGRMIMSPG